MPACLRASVPSIDDIMEQASQALVQMEYLRCEQLCLAALAEARRNSDFDSYARVLLPLQEARRQRRQIAVDAGVTVLAAPRVEPSQILDQHKAGCLLLVSPPYTATDEQAIREGACEQGSMVEVLLVDQPALKQIFEQQMERVGDAALAEVDPALSPVEQIDALAVVLERVGDHEIAHQRLAAAARHADRDR